LAFLVAVSEPVFREPLEHPARARDEASAIIATTFTLALRFVVEIFTLSSAFSSGGSLVRRGIGFSRR
jgi:hypothetical protein